MRATDPIYEPRPLEPAWPDSGGRPLLFLLDASSTLERMVLRGWVDRHRPGDSPADHSAVASIPKTRRRRPGDWRVNPRLRARLNRPADQYVVPLRVVWLAPERNGDRTARWSDLLKLGDPRDPGAIRQHWIIRRHPDRCVIIAGEPATTNDLRSRWEARRAASAFDEQSFTEFVSLQAALALEQAERRLRGSRYKVPRFVHQDLLSRGAVVHELEEIATSSGRPLAEVQQRAGAYLREMAAAHSPYVIDLVAQAIRLLIRRAYGDVLDYDRDELHAIYELGQKYPLVFLPSHKSNLDHLVLQLALYENGLPPNHTAGGINMNFFPIGPLVRRSGVFFIRRSFKGNPLYKFVVRRYIAYLLEKRFPLEWYLEGGRSRSGKLRSPQFGLLGYVVDAYRRGATDDVILIPVSIAYDQIQDVRGYAIEQAGGAKRGESIGYVVDAVRSLRRSHGSIHLRFGEPLSLAAESGLPAAAFDPDERNLAVQKIAFDVSVRINQVTPITPISLVALALLGRRDRALTVAETMTSLEPFVDYVRRNDLPTTETLQLDTETRVREALDALVEHGVVSRFDDGPETVFSIEPDQRLLAAYYRNTIIHFFLNAAIAELALLGAGNAPTHQGETVFWSEVTRLRDLLKFEFFFRRREEFRKEIEQELDDQEPAWRSHVAAGETLRALSGLRPLLSHLVLRPFLDAYQVVADALVDAPADDDFDDKAFLRRCLSLGGQYHLQRRIESAESVSMELFKSALQLARNRGLVVGGDVEARTAFAAEIAATRHAIEAIETLAAGRRTGMLG